LDTSTLAEIIRQCFDNATDGRFAPDDRAVFLADGKRLRGLLMNLLFAQFEEGTQEVVDANTKLNAVNADLKSSATSLAKTASTLRNVARLVGSLDRLLNVAVKFV
jgi:hypothetical protein